MSVKRPFSTSWVFVSLAVFIGVELLLGGVVYELVVQRYVSAMLHHQLQVLLYLGSFLLGGFAVGVVSPGIRIAEPAVGAFTAVFLTLLFGVFQPYHFAGFTMGKLLLGGGIAFALALVGAEAGERLMGNVRGA